MNNITDKLTPISNEEMKSFIDKLIAEEEENKWKKEERFENFLDYLVNYININSYVTSDDFYYDEDSCSPYTYSEFETYLNSLYDIVNKYGKENFISNDFKLTEEDCFVENSYCLKIKEKFYCIQLVVGQGSYISFEIVDDNCGLSYIDYELMMNNTKCPSYENNVKKHFSLELEMLINDFVERGAKKDMLKSILKEYK